MDKHTDEDHARLRVAAQKIFADAIRAAHEVDDVCHAVILDVLISAVAQGALHLGEPISEVVANLIDTYLSNAGVTLEVKLEGRPDRAH